MKIKSVQRCPEIIWNFLEHADWIFCIWHLIVYLVLMLSFHLNAHQYRLVCAQREWDRKIEKRIQNIWRERNRHKNYGITRKYRMCDAFRFVVVVFNVYFATTHPVTRTHAHIGSTSNSSSRRRRWSTERQWHQQQIAPSHCDGCHSVSYGNLECARGYP